MEASELAQALRLAPHPEGGWFRRVWTSDKLVGGHSGARPAASAILYLLEGGATSRWHRLTDAEELWVWRAGDPLDLQLGGLGAAPGAGSIHRLSPGADDPALVVVPARHWQRAICRGTRWTLTTCLVSPAFDYSAFEMASEYE